MPDLRITATGDPDPATGRGQAGYRSMGTSLGTPRHAPESGHLLDAKVNVLLDAEPEVAILGEVAPLQLVLLHLQTTLQDLLSLIERNKKKTRLVS